MSQLSTFLQNGRVKIVHKVQEVNFFAHQVEFSAFTRQRRFAIIKPAREGTIVRPTSR